MPSAVLSIDLAYKRHADIGAVVLRADGRGVHARGVAVELPDPPEPARLADWIETTAAAHDARFVCIDGPLGWQGADTARTHGSLHSRLSERLVRAPGKTGLPPDGVKPGGYLPFTRFSIALFETLTARGWALPDGTDCSDDADRAVRPLAAGRRIVSETFPTAAWRALGLPVLPGKARSRDADLAAAANALAGLRVVLEGVRTHDEFQATVAGLAGVWWAAGDTARVALHGLPPVRLDGAWREGYIMLPRPS